MTPEFLEIVLKTILDALEKVGFHAAIIVIGHISEQQNKFIRRVTQEYGGTMHVYGTDDMEWAKDIGFTSDHAAKWETSILLHRRPDLVDIDRFPKDTAVPLEKVYGYDPRIHASRELGERAVRSIARDLARKGQELLKQPAVPGSPGK